MNRSQVCATFAAMMLAGSIACKNDPVLNRIQVPSNASFAFVTTTDFQVGSSSVVWMGDTYAVEKDIAAVHSDAVARFFGGLVYVVNRLGADNIQVLDPANRFSTVVQFSVENGSDPHDIAVVNATKAYVTRYNKTDLWIVNPTTGVQTGSISLAALADGDGIPEIDHLLLVGDRLFVSVQRVDRNTPSWSPVGTSYLAVVDAAADTVIDVDPATAGWQAIALAASNPFSAVQLDAATGNLYVAGVGDWGVADGGVAAVNPVTFASQGIMLAGASVGGDITDIELVNGQTGYAIITNSNFHNMLLRFNPTTGAVTDTLYAPGAFVLQDIELAPTGELFLADRTPTNPGIRIYNAQSGTETTGAPIDVGLPPFKIAFGVAR